MNIGTPRALARNLGEWFWRGSALGQVSAHLPGPRDPGGRAFEQARLLRAVVAQVSQPDDQPRGGSRQAVLLGLCRDLVTWTLAAGNLGGDTPPAELAALWQQTPGDRLRVAAGGAANLEAVRGLLLDSSGWAALDVGDADVTRAVAFAESLYQEMEAPRRRVDAVLRQRWIRLGVLVVAVLASLVAIRAKLQGPDLAKERPFRTSSSFSGCADDRLCAAQMFHTADEVNPWIEFDVGAAKRVGRVEVENRVDCCQERAVPLVVELSNDRSSWREVARQEKEFTSWTAEFPRTRARYVRLRVLRSTMLHLHDVTIR